jgi:hypothetical protein
MANTTPPTLANGKICFIEMPAIEISQSAAFYKEVFGWRIRHRSDGDTSFDDTVGVICKPLGDSTHIGQTWRTTQTDNYKFNIDRPKPTPQANARVLIFCRRTNEILMPTHIWHICKAHKSWHKANLAKEPNFTESQIEMSE